MSFLDHIAESQQNEKPQTAEVVTSTSSQTADGSSRTTSRTKIPAPEYTDPRVRLAARGFEMAGTIENSVLAMIGSHLGIPSDEIARTDLTHEDALLMGTLWVETYPEPSESISPGWMLAGIIAFQFGLPGAIAVFQILSSRKEVRKHGNGKDRDTQPGVDRADRVGQDMVGDRRGIKIVRRGSPDHIDRSEERGELQPLEPIA